MIHGARLYTESKGGAIGLAQRVAFSLGVNYVIALYESWKSSFGITGPLDLHRLQRRSPEAIFADIETAKTAKVHFTSL